MSDTYKVKVKGATPGASFTLYLNAYPQPIVGGKAHSEEFEIEISKEFTGEGKFKILGRSNSRSFQNIAYSVPVKLTSKSGQSVDFGTNFPVKPVVTAETTSPITEDKSTVDEIKEITDNDLRDDAQDAIKNATTNELQEKIDKKKSGNSFWDNLK